jgi:CDP-6-deoxy-D-xylo-4-hexulose-3-dehydrase
MPHLTVTSLDWPLMHNNITRPDLARVVDFLSADEPPILTQSTQVAAFEEEWSRWLGVPFSVFVNSGSSANQLTLAVLRWLTGPGEVIVPTLTWVSDVAAVLQNGFDPVFVDIDRRTLGMDPQAVLARITPRTRAVFLTHVLGYSGLTEQLAEELDRRGVLLIEDVCESHGATFRGRKLGSIGAVSNFSFYYAHHMSTIEGGMVSTTSEAWFQRLRMLRSHGMVRESTSPELKRSYAALYPDLNPDFIFAQPAYNFRSTEINAVIGRSQLPHLDANNVRRRANLDLFLRSLDPSRYRTDFAVEGSSNYALNLVLAEADLCLRDNVVDLLRAAGVEFRRGLSGGGNQLRQPYLRERFPSFRPEDFPEVDHVHFFGFYLGNYPGLQPRKIETLCEWLNRLPAGRRIDVLRAPASDADALPAVRADEPQRPGGKRPPAAHAARPRWADPTAPWTPTARDST